MSHPSSPRPLGIGACCLALGLAVAACTPTYRPDRAPPESTQPQVDESLPSWVNNPPLDSRLIYAVGADVQHDRRRALADARRDLAQQLHIAIGSEDGDGEDASAGEGDDTPSDLVHVDASELPGLTVVQWKDTSSCTYVLVSFDRQAWADTLRHDIADIDARVSAIIRDLAQHPDPDTQTHPVAAQARLYQQLLPLCLQRDAKVQHLRIADPAGLIAPGAVSVGDLQSQLARVLASVSVDVVADASLDPILSQLIAGCANLGLHVVTGATVPSGESAPRLRLRLQLQTVPLTSDGLNRLDGTFQCLVELGSDGSTIGGLRSAVRSSALTETEARDRLMRKIIMRWNDYLHHAFITCLTRL